MSYKTSGFITVVRRSKEMKRLKAGKTELINKTNNPRKADKRSNYLNEIEFLKESEKVLPPRPNTPIWNPVFKNKIIGTIDLKKDVIRFGNVKMF